MAPLLRVIVVTEIIETYFINRFLRVIVVTEVIKVYFLNRLFHVIVVTEIIEAYFRLAPPLGSTSEADLPGGHIMEKSSDEW